MGNLIWVTLPNNRKILIDDTDTAVGVQILHGNYELPETEIVRNLVKPGWHCLDIGANIGYYTIIMADLVGTTGMVDAFEPLTDNYELLLRSIKENDFFKTCFSAKLAISDRVRKIDFAVFPLERQTESRNSGGSHLITQETTKYPPEYDVLSVWSADLDSMNLTRKIDFVKMDIEGAEMLAIRGMDRLLRRDHPIMLIEFNVPLLQRVSQCTTADLETVIRGYGYELEVIPGTDVKLWYNCLCRLIN